MLTLEPVGGSVFRVALSPDGGRVAVLRSAGYGESMLAWAERPDWRWRVVPAPDGGWPTAAFRTERLALHPAGRLAAVAGRGGVVVDLDAGTSSRFPYLGAKTVGLTFSPGGRELFELSAAGRRCWRAGGRECEHAPFPDDSRRRYRGLWLAPTSRLAASERNDPATKLARVRFLADPAGAGAEAAAREFGHVGSFSPDGSRFAGSGAASATLWVWDAWTGAPLAEVRRRGFRFVAPALTPDNRTVVAGQKSAVLAFDTGTGADRWAFNWNAGGVTALAVSGDGLTAAAGTQTGHVVLWDLDP